MHEEFAWDDKLLTGIKAIDDEHKKLFFIFNNLLRESNGEKSVAVISSVISELVDYTTTHFEREEAYMEEWGYTDLRRHKEQHVKLANAVNQIAENYENDPESTNLEEFATFLIDWLSNHILKTDMAYINYLKA